MSNTQELVSGLKRVQRYFVHPEHHTTGVLARNRYGREVPIEDHAAYAYNIGGAMMSLIVGHLSVGDCLYLGDVWIKACPPGFSPVEIEEREGVAGARRVIGKLIEYLEANNE